MKNFINLIASLFLSMTFAATAHSAWADEFNGEWTTLTGTVTDVKPQSFKLDIGKKKVLVEMDDYDWDADGFKLKEGDNVVVRGRADKDFFEKASLEAGSVYVKGIDTYFYANSDDEEGPVSFSTAFISMKELPTGATVDLIGKVVSVDGREFTVDTGWRKVNVDTSGMALNPMDNVGFVEIDKGDRVRVAGVIDDDFFDEKELKANYVVEY